MGILMAGLAATAMALLAGCGSSSSDAGEAGSPTEASFYTGGTPGGDPVSGGTATVVSSEGPTSLDPVTVAPPGSVRPSVSIFDTLAELMPGSKEPQPALAESWKESPDARTYTFELRPGVEFSNGEELSAEDVVYSFQRAKEIPYSTVAQFLTNLSEVVATGPMTVEAKFSKPEPAFIDLISLASFGIVPKDVVEEEGDKAFGRHPVGTGPFMLKSATADYSEISMVRNPRYWRDGLPHLDGLVFKLVENENSRLLAVRSGSAQLAIGVPYSQVSSLEDLPGVQMVIKPIWGAWIAPFNNTKAPLSDPKVLQALLYATPYQSIIDTVLKGRAVQSNSVVGSLVKYGSTDIAPVPFDQAKAKDLLKQAGLADGFSTTIQVQGGETSGELVASILQSAWKEIGVDLSVETLNFNSLVANVFAGKYDVQIFPPEVTVVESYDPGQTLNGYVGGELFPAMQSSARLKSTLNKAITEVDEKKRAQLFEEVLKISYLEDPSWLPLTELASLCLASDSLRNFDVLLNGHMRMEEVWLEQ
jgi:peptide/nickel transport system substrate-binding protein